MDDKTTQIYREAEDEALKVGLLFEAYISILPTAIERQGGNVILRFIDNMIRRYL